MEAIPEAPSETLARYVGELEASAHETAAIFGLSGLRIEVAPGFGWSSQKTEHGIVLTIDPLQVARKPNTEAVDKQDTAAIVEAIAQTDRRYTSFAICHELGHVRDFIDPEHQDKDFATKSDHFFWNIVDDAVINVRLRRVPALDACTDELFRDVLFSNNDFRNQAKHVQLMFGLLLHTVIGDTPPVSDDVQQIIDRLKAVPAAGAIFNIMQVLADPSTSLRERRLIAEQYIKPTYDALLQEDEQHSPDDSNEDVYDTYEHAMHGHSDSKAHSQDDQASKAEDSPAGHLTNSPRYTAVRHVSDMLKEKEKEHEEASPPPPDRLKQVAQTSRVITELGLSQQDAETYLRDLETYRAAIIAVAKEFERLAIPSVNTLAPRYGHQARYAGASLHHHRLAQAAIQLRTGQEQPIWRAVERRGKSQSFSLEKLDVHLLTDVSGSMQAGSKAEHASAAALILIEGLALARRNLSKQHSRTTKPDVRLQIVAFGVNTEVAVPLTHTPTLAQRGQMYTSINNPRAHATLVANALLTIKETASQHPSRTQLAFIISDGQFDDYHGAKRIVGDLPEQNCHISQFIIGDPSISPITKDPSYIRDPRRVPQGVRELGY